MFLFKHASHPSHGCGTQLQNTEHELCALSKGKKAAPFQLIVTW